MAADAARKEREAAEQVRLASPPPFAADAGEKIQYEGELVVVIGQKCKNLTRENALDAVLGYTIGNDMSSRDIEGENLLYLPQAKTYLKSCAVGPFITVGASEAEARAWTIGVEIQRGRQAIFNGETSVGQIKRTFDSLAEFLFRSQSFPNGAVLLTGTGVVPPDSFTLAAGDRVRIRISGIGTLENPVVVV